MNGSASACACAHVGAAALMVLLTAVLVVLPIALAAPGGAEDVGQSAPCRSRTRCAAGLPAAPDWVVDVPLVGHTIADLVEPLGRRYQRMAESCFRPYLGIVAESGLSVLLGIANGVVLFLLALFIAFFFCVYGEPVSRRLQTDPAPDRGRAGRAADQGHRRDRARRRCTASSAPRWCRAS